MNTEKYDIDDGEHDELTWGWGRGSPKVEKNPDEERDIQWAEGDE